MKMTEAVELLAGLTYKPGWAIRTDIDHQRKMLTISCIHYAQTPDNMIGLPTRIENRTAIHATELGAMNTPGDTLQFIVSDLVRKTELDEMAAWLKLNGKHLLPQRP